MYYLLLLITAKIYSIKYVLLDVNNNNYNFNHQDLTGTRYKDSVLLTLRDKVQFNHKHDKNTLFT